MTAGTKGSWSGGGESDGELLVGTADRLRWRAPELALVFARHAATRADAAQDRVLALRANALVVAALVRLGKHAEAVEPAVLTLREAESSGARELAGSIRVDLAASTRAIGLAGSAFVLVRPMLEGSDARPSVRAGALAEIVAGLAQAGRREVIDEVLSEADRLYAADDSLGSDVRRVLRALLCARIASFRRRWGNPTGAVAAATEGMTLLDGLAEPETDSGQARAELGLEMVSALLDAGEDSAALGQADQTLNHPVRATSAAAIGRLMLILATRVHFPSGRPKEAHALLAEIVRVARRHELDGLLADVLTSLAHAQEADGELTDALNSLRSARAAEQRRLRADTMARLIVLEELGAGTRLPDDTEALLRRVVRTPARSLPDTSGREYTSREAAGREMSGRELSGEDIGTLDLLARELTGWEMVARERAAMEAGSGRALSDLIEADRAAPDWPVPDRTDSDWPAHDRTNSDHSASGLTSSEWPGSDRTSSDRAASDRAGSDRAGSDRTSSDWPGSGRDDPEYAASDQIGSDWPSSDRHGSAQASSDWPGSDRAGADDAASDLASSDWTSSGRGGSDRTDSDWPGSDRIATGQASSDWIGSDHAAAGAASSDWTGADSDFAAAGHAGSEWTGSSRGESDRADSDRAGSELTSSDWPGSDRVSSDWPSSGRSESDSDRTSSDWSAGNGIAAAASSGGGRRRAPVEWSAADRVAADRAVSELASAEADEHADKVDGPQPKWPDQGVAEERDEETGLLNRQGLRRRLAAARRQSRPTALTLVRLEPTEPDPEPEPHNPDPDSTDRFSAALIKAIDRAGRVPEFDPDVLNSLADHVRDMAPDDAELVRPEEGELAVLMPDTTRDEAEQFAATLRETVSTSDWDLEDPARGVSVSTGVAQYQEGTSEDALLTAAREDLTSTEPDALPDWHSVEPVYDLPPEDSGYTFMQEYAQLSHDGPEADAEMAEYLAGFSLPEYGQWSHTEEPNWTHTEEPDMPPRHDTPAADKNEDDDTAGRSVLDRLEITRGSGGRRRAPDSFAADQSADYAQYPSADETPYPPSDPSHPTDTSADVHSPSGDFPHRSGESSYSSDRSPADGQRPSDVFPYGSDDSSRMPSRGQRPSGESPARNRRDRSSEYAQYPPDQSPDYGGTGDEILAAAEEAAALAALPPAEIPPAADLYAEILNSEARRSSTPPASAPQNSAAQSSDPDSSGPRASIPHVPDPEEIPVPPDAPDIPAVPNPDIDPQPGRRRQPDDPESDPAAPTPGRRAIPKHPDIDPTPDYPTDPDPDFPGFPPNRDVDPRPGRRGLPADPDIEPPRERLGFPTNADDESPRARQADLAGESRGGRRRAPDDVAPQSGSVPEDLVQAEPRRRGRPEIPESDGEPRLGRLRFPDEVANGDSGAGEQRPGRRRMPEQDESRSAPEQQASAGRRRMPEPASEETGPGPMGRGADQAEPLGGQRAVLGGQAGRRRRIADYLESVERPDADAGSGRRRSPDRADSAEGRRSSGERAGSTESPDLEASAGRRSAPSPEQRPSPQPRPEHRPELKAERRLEPRAEPRPQPRPEPRAERAEPRADRSEPRADLRPEPNPEPRFESNPEPAARPRSHSDPEPKAEPRREPNREPNPEPVARSRYEVDLDAQARSRSESNPESAARSRSESNPEAQAQPRRRQDPEAQVQPSLKSQSEPAVQPSRKPNPEPQAQPRPQPQSEPRPDLKQPAPKPESQPALTQAPEPTPEQTPTPEPDLGTAKDPEEPRRRRWASILDGQERPGLPPEPSEPRDPPITDAEPVNPGKPSRNRRRDKTDVKLADLLAEALVAYQASTSDNPDEDVLSAYDDAAGRVVDDTPRRERETGY